MIKKNEILGAYEEFFCDPQTWEIGQKSMLFLAQNDSREFQNLIDLFNSRKEGSSDEIAHKLGLSMILVRLNYEPVKDFLAKVTNEGCLRHQIWAAIGLIEMNDEWGLGFVEKNIDDMSEDQIRSFVLELTEPELFDGPTKFGARALLTISEKDERINHWIDRLKIREKLTKLAS